VQGRSIEFLPAKGESCFFFRHSMTSPINFEVRMPACDRPDMLRRALQALEAQDYPYWKAIVYDDSRSSDVRDVVQCVTDDRISYCRNPVSLGAARNIDQCFHSAPLLGGDYGCLLEDDNFWLPGFLSLVANRLQERKWRVVLSNQRINDQEVGLRPVSQTTRGGWFSAGSVGPLDLRATLLFTEGLSNGGLIWALGGYTNLQVGATVQETGLHEACRSLLMGHPFLFVDEPLAVWTSMPKSESARASEYHRLIGRGMQSVRDFVLHTHGEAVVRVAKSLAARLGLTDRLVEAIAYSRCPTLVGELRKGRHLLVSRAFSKGLAIRLVEKDPCATFFKTGRPALISGAGSEIAHAS
jgi:hypothetical protein